MICFSCVANSVKSVCANCGKCEHLCGNNCARTRIIRKQVFAEQREKRVGHKYDLKTYRNLTHSKKRAKKPKKVKPLPVFEVSKCPSCQRSFLKKKNNQIYCSIKCRKKKWRYKAERMTCLGCQRLFLTKHSLETHCSRKCYRKMANKRYYYKHNSKRRA